MGIMDQPSAWFGAQGLPGSEHALVSNLAREFEAKVGVVQLEFERELAALNGLPNRAIAQQLAVSRLRLRLFKADLHSGLLP
jgi:hypothetical protein